MNIGIFGLLFVVLVVLSILGMVSIWWIIVPPLTWIALMIILIVIRAFESDKSKLERMIRNLK